MKNPQKNNEKKPTDIGMNRTGIDMSPIQSKEVIAEAERTPPDPLEDGIHLQAERAYFISQAMPVGSIPPPGSLKGVASTSIQKLTGKRPEVLIDKLGERLAFERTGTRIYEALIQKCQVLGLNSSTSSVDILKQFRDEEAQHFDWVRNAMKSLGADPTSVTPCADINAVASMGLRQVMSDPRTSVAQSIQMILIAELADHDGWSLLIKLVEEMGLGEMAMNFREALDQETIHLQTIRKIHEELVLADAKVA